VSSHQTRATAASDADVLAMWAYYSAMVVRFELWNEPAVRVEVDRQLRYARQAAEEYGTEAFRRRIA
jgi:hypothetical protein